jgi:hypothetical protein
LPSIISLATQQPPEHQAASGSAVVTMSGQIGMVIGVSLPVIMLAMTDHADPHHYFAVAWILSAALILVSAPSSVR